MTDEVIQISIPVLDEDIREEKEEIEDISRLLDEMELGGDQAAQKEVSEILSELRTKRSEIEQAVNEALRPATEVIDKIVSRVDEILELYADAERELKIKFMLAKSAYQSKVENVRKAINKAVLQGNEDALDDLLSEYKRLDPGDDYIPIKQEWWDFDVIDQTKIPPEFLVVNQPLIKRTITIHKGSTDIPGIRVYRRHA